MPGAWCQRGALSEAALARHQTTTHPAARTQWHSSRSCRRRAQWRCVHPSQLAGEAHGAPQASYGPQTRALNGTPHVRLSSRASPTAAAVAERQSSLFTPRSVLPRRGLASNAQRGAICDQKMRSSNDALKLPSACGRKVPVLGRRAAPAATCSPCGVNTDAQRPAQGVSGPKLACTRRIRGSCGVGLRCSTGCSRSGDQA